MDQYIYMYHLCFYECYSGCYILIYRNLITYYLEAEIDIAFDSVNCMRF